MIINNKVEVAQWLQSTDSKSSCGFKLGYVPISTHNLKNMYICFNVTWTYLDFVPRTARKKVGPVHYINLGIVTKNMSIHTENTKNLANQSDVDVEIYGIYTILI